MKNFMDKVHIHSIYRKNENNEFVKKKVLQIERVSRFTAYFLVILIAINCLSWMLKPTLHNIKHFEEIMNKSMEFQYYIYFWTPLDYKYNLRDYIIIHTLCIYLGATAVTVIVTFDIFNFIAVFHVVAHIQILKNNVKSNWSDDFNESEKKGYLVSILEYHAYIIRIFGEVQSAFGLNVASNYLQNLIEDGLFLYQIMNGEKENVLMYGLMIILYLGGLIFLSIVLEEIRRQNYDLCEYVYALPWEGMSLENQKIFVVFLQRTQPDLEFETVCGMKAGVKPAFSIVKSMFSYYVMINSRF
uniref:Uncharacterized protein n=1 Tax=Bombyx mori TaxID=7091 RepID=A0A8R2R003_BOMMO|nr:olfactory receptor 6 isoform X1 [Bombyx mori]